MLVLWISIAVVMVLVIIVFSKITIHVHIEKHQHDDEIVFRVKALFGLIRYTYRVPDITFKGLKQGIHVKSEKSNNFLSFIGKQSDSDNNITFESIVNYYHMAIDILHHTVAFKAWIRKTMERTTCSNFQWFSSIGVGNAAHTAIATGMIWGLKSQIVGLLFRYIHLQSQPHLRVMPSYAKKQFVTDVMCTFHMRMSSLMLAIISLLIKAGKVRGGIRAWREVIHYSK